MDVAVDKQPEEESQEEPPTRPMRDEAKKMSKIKGKGICPSLEYEAKRLSLVDNIAETTRMKKEIQNT